MEHGTKRKVYAYKLFRNKNELSKKHIRVLSDNKATISIINKIDTSQKCDQIPRS